MYQVEYFRYDTWNKMGELHPDMERVEDYLRIFKQVNNITDDSLIRVVEV